MDVHLEDVPVGEPAGGVQEVQLGGLLVDLDPLELVGHVLQVRAAELQELFADLELDVGERLFARRQAAEVIARKLRAVEVVLQLGVGFGLDVDVVEFSGGLFFPGRLGVVFLVIRSQSERDGHNAAQRSHRDQSSHGTVLFAEMGQP